MKIHANHLFNEVGDATLELLPVLQIRVRDPVPFFTPGSGMDKKSGSGSGLNNPDHISESLKNFFLG
jgi:hypothetical protein